MASKTKASASNSTEADIEQFIAITGASKSVAKRLLEACNGNLELAIDMQMDGGGDNAPCDSLNAVASTSGGAMPTDEDDIRAPIPQKNETLVEDVPTYVSLPPFTDLDDMLGWLL